MNVFLVLLETSANQAYIFSTNRMKENMGASELTYRVGTEWVLEEVSALTRKRLWHASPNERHARLKNPELNPPIETKGTTVEVVVATSGKAVLLTNSQENAKQIIRNVTHHALKQAPGMDVCGVYVGFNFETESIHKALESAMQKHKFAQADLRSKGFRFQRVPIVADCVSSGWPAKTVNIKDQLLSDIADTKQRKAKFGHGRFRALAKSKGLQMSESIDNLVTALEGMPWMGVVHADGNGLGQMFQNFDEATGTRDHIDNRKYVQAYRDVSLSIEECTESAFFEALTVFDDKSHTGEANKIAVMPFIIGGDDLTVVCDGKRAIDFVEKYLLAFENHTLTCEAIKSLNDCEAFKRGKYFAACAGIAFVKPHFPFHLAYELAEELIGSAKKVKQKVNPQCSAFDFHVLFDSSFVDLADIRRRLLREKTVDGKTTQELLYGGPYIISNLTPPQIEESINKDWITHHSYKELKHKISSLAQTRHEDDESKSIPNSQIHEIRTALHHGRKHSDGFFKSIVHRYKAAEELYVKGLNGIKQDSLWWISTEDGQERSVTSLLDAMLLQDFCFPSKEGDK